MVEKRKVETIIKRVENAKNLGNYASYLYLFNDDVDCHHLPFLEVGRRGGVIIYHFLKLGDVASFE
jgi:hypothetical protein